MDNCEEIRDIFIINGNLGENILIRVEFTNGEQGRKCKNFKYQGNMYLPLEDLHDCVLIILSAINTSLDHKCSFLLKLHSGERKEWMISD